MHPFWEKVEEKNSKLIPPALVLLLGIIIFELFFHTENHIINLIIEILDALIIAIFVIDLIFLAIHARSTAFFFKNYWLDILAILPLGLFFKAASRLYETAVLGERVTVGQAMFHESLEVRKGIAEFLKSSKSAKVARIVARFARVIFKSKIITNLFERFHIALTTSKRGVNTRKKRSWNHR